MFYKTKKVLCSSLVISLLNTSFYPLYAGHKHHPSAEDSRDESKRPRPRGLVLDDYLQNKFNSSAQTIQIWTPAFIKNSVSSVFNAIGSWFDNMIEELPPHMFAKTFFEIDYARDRDYWRAHFTTAIEELKSAPDQARLEDLQDIVWNGLISPYLFEEEVKELNIESSFVNEFHKTLKSSPGFITQSFHRDLLDVLKEIRYFGDGIDGFKAMLTYYREFENSLDYKQSLNAFRDELQRRKKEKTLPLTNKQYNALNKSIYEGINKSKKDERRYLKIERYASGLFSRELPFYNKTLPETFNSSLFPISHIEEEPYSLISTAKGTLKGATRLFSNGMKFAQEHPFEALCIGLFTQLTAASALRLFMPPKGVPQPNKEVNQKEIEVNKRSFAKRAIGDEFLINQNTTGMQTSPSIEGLTNGNTFVVWEGYQSDPSGDIYGRIVSPNGTVISNEFGINQNTTLAQRSPKVASLTNGNMFVIWQGFQTGDSDIYGRTFDPNGTPLSNEFRINQNTTSDQYYQQLARLTNGNVFVTWMGAQNDPSGDIYGRIYFPNGTALTNDFTINQNTTNIQFTPSVASLTNGNAFVAWNGYQTGNWDCYGRVVFPNGTTLTNEFGINKNITGNQLSLQVVSLGSGNVFVTWEGDQTGNYDIYGGYFSPYGVAIGNDFTINQVTASDQRSPQLASLTNDNFFLTWKGSQNSGYVNIYGRMFSNYGMALGDEFGINQNINFNHGAPSVTGLNNSNVFVAWPGNENGNYNIYGRIFTNDTLSSYLYPTTVAPTLATTTPSASPSTSKTPGTTQKMRTTPGASSSKPDNTPVIVGATLGTLCAVPLIGTGIYYGVKKYKQFSRKISPEEVKLEEAPGIQAETIIGEKKRQFQLIKLMDLSTFQTLEKITGIPFDEEKTREGAHGSVKPAIEINSKTQDFVDVVAAKFIEGEEMIQHSKNELDILQELGRDQKNSYTSYLLDSYIYDPKSENLDSNDPKSILSRKFPQKTEIIFTHWFSGGDGNDFVERLPLLTNNQDKTLLLNSLIRGLFHAVEYINETKTIFHNDINPGNVLLDMKTGYFRLNDWGSASQTSKLTGHERIKKGYLSPERFAFIKGQTKIQPDTAQSDSWSMAVVSWEFLFNGVNPFKDSTSGNMADTIDDLSEKNKDQKDGLTPELLNIFQKRLTAKQALDLKILGEKDTTTREWRVQILMDLITKQRQKKNTKQDENSFKSYEMSKINHMNQDDKYLNPNNSNYEGIPSSPSEKLKQLGSKVQERNYINVTRNGNKNTSTNLHLTDSKDKSSERHYENVSAVDESPYEGMLEVKNKDNTYENLPKVDVNPYEEMPETKKERVYENVQKN